MCGAYRFASRLGIADTVFLLGSSSSSSFFSSFGATLNSSVGADIIQSGRCGFSGAAAAVSCGHTQTHHQAQAEKIQSSIEAERASQPDSERKGMAARLRHGSASTVAAGVAVRGGGRLAR
eukprot:COSAG03_NODE_14884_length_448_cov_2.361032_1_plen_120_part_01